MKESKAEVIEDGDKFYAVYKDKDGKEVKQKITEEEAEELGYEKEIKRDSITNEMDDESINLEKKESKSNINLIIVIILAVIIGLSGGVYYYYRKKL